MIRLGVVGFGLRMQLFINTVLKRIDPDIRVVGIIDPNEAGVRQRLMDEDRSTVVFYHKLDELVAKAKPDALMIGTRCNLHTPYAIEASQFDIPLFLEKPVSISMEQARELEKAYANVRSEVLVSFPLRVSPLCVEAKMLLENSAVGRCDHIAATNYVPYGTVYWEDGYRNYQITQGLFLQKATHDIDYIAYLMGSRITRVAAMATIGKIFGGSKSANLRCLNCSDARECLESPANRKRNRSGGLEKDHLCVFGSDCGDPRFGMNEDSSSVLVEFATGAHGIYTQVFYSRRDAQARGAIISGYHGTLSFDWYKNEIRLVQHHNPFTNTIKADSGMSHFGGDEELALNLLDIINGKAKSRCTIWDGIQSVYVCLAAKDSMQSGVFMPVRQVGQ